LLPPLFSLSHRGAAIAAGALTRAEVEQEVNELAMGFETSSKEVEAKQEVIQGRSGTRKQFRIAGLRATGQRI
jgi:hypothetical protein